jgi:hypothetical protein
MKKESGDNRRVNAGLYLLGDNVSRKNMPPPSSHFP